MGAWLGWDREPLPLLERPSPPRPKHVRILSACAVCHDGLEPRRRCTKDLDAVALASDADLAYCRVPGTCILDADAELERRMRQREYGPPRVSLPTLSERIVAHLKGLRG